MAQQGRGSVCVRRKGLESGVGRTGEPSGCRGDNMFDEETGDDSRVRQVEPLTDVSRTKTAHKRSPT